ncbi:MAG TPA: hypothetical protein VK524_34645 [Polyangiaceae bacterium]|nr:hypothetical protein [Polyangiaceae bacterium]
MIGQQLKVEIEEYAERLRGSSNLLRRARQGTLGRPAVLAFLWNIRYVLRETPSYLALARGVAEERGQRELAAFYEQKIADESGHDRWADQDLVSLDPKLDLVRSTPPMEPLSELMVFLRSTIRREPADLLVYMLFAEYLTVLLGPDWIAALESHCGIPASSMTSIGKHVELDKDHVQDDLATLRALLPRDADVVRLQETLRCFMAYWERFYEQLAELPN